MEDKIKMIIVVAVAIITGVLLIGYINNGECGDGICQKIEEETGSCPQDCVELLLRAAVCGNDVCETGENFSNCPEDCEETVIKQPSEVSDSKTCAELNGDVCDVGEDCGGQWLDATDTFSCCSQSCQSSANGSIIDIDTFELAPENEDLGDIN